MIPDYLTRYIRIAPISLALERAIECRMLSTILLADPLLDIGCGDGLFASVFYDQPRAVGLDRSVSALTRARGGYRFRVAADAAALPFADGTFSTVLANSMLEHTTSLNAILFEACRVLVHGGRFVLTVPTPSYQEAFFYSQLARSVGWPAGAARYERFVNGVFAHREVHDVRGWRERLSRAGFTVTDVQPYLSKLTIALSDLLYPSAAFSRIADALLGHYFLLPALRRLSTPLLAAVLRPLYLQNTSDGGYAMLVAERIS
jgi:ubiquinone/menaquinone biosynthesis C-methylase UbiE